MMEKQKPTEERRVTGRLLLCVCGAVLGSFNFGYNIGVINAPESLVKDFMNTTAYERDGAPLSDDTLRLMWALTTSIFAVGGMVGGIAGGWWATRFGRRGGCLVNTGFGLVASVLMLVSRRAEVYELLIFARVVIGVVCGLYTALSPLYLSEISTPNIRGALGVTHQLAVTLGILTSQVLGFPDLLGRADTWDVLFALCGIPCLLQILTLAFCPESPRFLLINRDDEDGCRKALVILRGDEYVDDEIDEIRHEMMSSIEEVSMLELFRSPSLRPPLLIGIVMQLSQQLSGINGVFFYSTSLFEDVGLDPDSAKYTTSAVGATMVVMTMITVPLIDRLGRRTLHLTGVGGMVVFSVLMTVALSLRGDYLWLNEASIPVTMLYVVSFAVGPGSIPWLIVAELFSHSARPAAMSVCVLVNWMSSFIVAFIFPSMQEALGDFTFLPFTALLVAFFLFTYFRVPETRGKTFEEVTAIWKVKDSDYSSISKSKYSSEDITGRSAETNFGYSKD